MQLVVYAKDFEPVAFTMKEGGCWYPWRFIKSIESCTKGFSIHSIAFEDGSVFDWSLQGWRPTREGVIEILFKAGAAYQRDYVETAYEPR